MKCKINDIADVISQSIPNPSESGYDIFVGLEHYDSGEVKVTRYGSTKNLVTAVKVFNRGDILLARRNVYLKRAGLVDFEGVTSGDSIVLRVKNDLSQLGVSSLAIQTYLPFVLNTEDFWNYAEKYSDGTMSKRLSPKTLLQYEFEIPKDIDEKNNLLWQAYATKEAYRTMITSIDEMVKSQFISQFGFPQDGEVMYPISSIEDLLEETISGEWGTDCSEGDGTPVIRTTNFTNEGVLDLSNVVLRNIEPKKIVKKHLKRGDIILEKSGGTKDNPVGRLVYFNEDGVYLANNFTQVLRPDKRINSRYLFAALFYLYQTHKALIKGLGNQTNGIQNLKVPQYLKLHVCVPDISKQESFENVIRQADKSKFELKKAIEKIDNVMRSIMQ